MLCQELNVVCFVGINVILKEIEVVMADLVAKTRWLFPVAVSIHNLEEGIWMPRFWRAHSWNVISSTEFRVVLVAIAALAFLITYVANRAKPKSVAVRLFLTFCAILFLNAIFHMCATIYLRSYAPGVVTAMAIVLPATTYLIYKERMSQ